jgi:hypothetical protein
MRVVPEIVAALDLAESLTPALAELGHMRLKEFGDALEPSWHRRPQRRRSVRSIVSSSARVPRPHPRLQQSAVADALWDDRAEQDARGLVALLFVARGMRPNRAFGGAAGVIEPSSSRLRIPECVDVLSIVACERR